MQISSRFTLAVHIFACVDTFKDDYKVTSDFYRAVECVEDNKLFHFHENPNAACPVGRNIHHVLDEKLTGAESNGAGITVHYTGGCERGSGFLSGVGK